jgi:heptosyltransferase-3
VAAHDDIGGVREPSIERERGVVVFPGALGDFLLALPALRALRARHLGAELTLVLNDWLRGLASVAGVADRVVALDRAEAAGLFAGDVLPSWLAGHPTVYTWLGAADEALRTRLARAARRVHALHVERGAGRVHAAAAYARAVGAPTTPRALREAAAFDPPPSSRADALLAGLDGPVLAVHPGAGARAKRWDAAGFVQVAHWWRSARGAVVVVAGPAEAGEAPVVPGAPDVRDWSLTDLAAVLGRVVLYLGADSGVSHLAGAVGAPSVVLFGPTEARRWRPLGRRVTVLEARAHGPEGIPLAALPAARVIAACRRRFTLTRGTLDTSVPD